jgi:hypothetical protein
MRPRLIAEALLSLALAGRLLLQPRGPHRQRRNPLLQRRRRHDRHRALGSAAGAEALTE